MDTLETARMYIKQGWSVFPVPYGKKEPVIKWGEFRERYATDEELIKWFGTGKSNIGIACGKLSNLSVLDADGTTGIALLGSLGLTSTGTVRTGSGGKQLFYKYGGERNKWESKDHEGLDSRGEGGYVVAPPSLHPCGMVYRWIGGLPNPSALGDFPSTAFTPKQNQQSGTSHVAVAPEPWLLEALNGVPASEPRHGVLIKLASYFVPRHNYEVCKMMLLEWNKKNGIPYPEDQVVKQLDDISKRFQTGQYKSTFVAKKESVEVKPSAKEPLEISTPANDADTYLTEISVVPEPPELPTGLASLDEATWGLHRGDVITIGARPGTGKTSLAINVASHLCGLGKRVVYFSTEMSKAELYNAIFASQGGVDAFRLSNKQLNDDDKRKLMDFMPTFKKYDIHFIKLFTPDQRAVQEAIDTVKPDVLIFDHLQHIASGENKYAELDKFIKFLKKTAIENNISVVACSQLKRIEEGRLPELSDLKECGTIEEESSICILLHTDKKDVKRTVLFRVAKNRHGRCGDTTMAFDGPLTKFNDMAVKVS